MKIVSGPVQQKLKITDIFHLNVIAVYPGICPTRCIFVGEMEDVMEKILGA